MATTCPTSFCLVYHIAESASWSDGTPVTADDFAYTARVNMDLADEARPPGYDLISGIDVIDEKTLRLSFTGRLGSWQSLFARVLPASYGSLDVVTMPKTGPFDLAAWVEGDQMVLARNNAWWAGDDPISGTPVGTVDELTVRFLDDVTDSVAALADGEIDVVSARPDAELVSDLRELEDVVTRVTPGPFWEHIDFHLDDPLLGMDWVRRAVALAIDRGKILEATVRLVDPSAPGLGNTVWMASSAPYEDHMAWLGHDPAESERILVDNGCSRGDDGVQVCAGRRLSFIWTSTNDDPARLATYESVRADLEVVGIELVADLRSPSQFVTREHLFGGADVWQMANFSWKDLLDPQATDQRYSCAESDLNVTGYCSEATDAALEIARSETATDLRATAYNEVDRLYLEDLAVIPLYQKPTMMAWRSELSGLTPNFTRSTDLWNVAAWTGKSSIVIALPGEPATLDPRSTVDEPANAVLSTLMYGAFSMAPDQTQVPLLISSAEIIEG